MDPDEVLYEAGFEWHALAELELYEEEASESVDRWIEILLDVFRMSPECEALKENADAAPSWVDLVFKYGISHEGVPPSKLDEMHVEEIVFEVFPRKVHCKPDEAGEILAALRAFWNFAARLFPVQAPALFQARLAAEREDELRRGLANPTNWGMAKTFFIEGESAGFDMQTEEGLQSWTALLNSRLPTLAPPPPDPPLDLVMPSNVLYDDRLRDNLLPNRLLLNKKQKSSQAKKTNRKQQRAARRKNRR